MNNYYQIYINDVLALVQTLVIKSEDTVQAQNDYVNLLAQQGTVPAVDTLDPTTWRYYMNLAGQYHPADTLMQVVSLDTLETIDFTVANLQVHRATFAAYQFGTRQYEELVTLFPQQETLIKGILHPVDINVAIAAADWTILYYDPDLVEVNEYSLIRKLQAFLQDSVQTWVNRKYNLKHEYYPMLYHGMFYLMLVPEVLNLRLEACLTNEAHSYHVRMYLASHLGLDTYLDALTTRQALWLYRNINYILRNTGQQQMFDTLLNELLTDRSIPLNQISMRHDVSGQPTDLDPAIVFDRILLNPGTSSSDHASLGLDELLTLQQPSARSNADVQGDVEPVMATELQYSLSNQLQTKSLESAMVDYTNSNVYNLPDILLNHWLYLSGLGVYETFIFPVSPKSGAPIPMNAKDAWVVMLYCMAQTYGIDLSTVAIPQLPAYRVQAVPLAKVTDMQRVIPNPYRTQSLPILQQMLAMNPAITLLTSTEAFVNLCVSITTAAQQQRNLVAQTNDMYHHAYLFAAVDQIYADVMVSIADPGEIFSVWFKDRNIDLTGFSSDEYAELALAISNQATGQDGVVTLALKDLQNAMIGIFSVLSSYSIQFIPRINQSTLRKLDTMQLRIGDDTVASIDFAHLSDENVVILSDQVQASDAGFMDVAQVASTDLGVQTTYDLFQDVDIGILPGHTGVAIQQQFGLDVWVKATTTDQHGNDIPMGGIDLWYTLTPAQQSSLAEVMSDELFYWQPPA